ncbi:MAG: fumarate hydratase C-terminal domain-containing protein [Pseudomonadota bacterium]
MSAKTLTIPLTEEQARQLNAGDVIYLNGPVFTAMSQFHIRYTEKNILPPLDFNRLNVLVHAGPLMKRVEDKWVALGIDPTSSLYMDKYGPAITRGLGLRAIVGKTTMGRETMAAMKEMGCVHLTIPGVMGNILASQVKAVLEVHDLEALGANEATWVIDLEKAGPFIVDIDARGNNFIQKRYEEVEKEFQRFYEKYGLQGFDFIHVGA